MKKPTEMTSARDKASFGEATTYHVRIARVKLLVSVGFFEVSNLSYVGRSNAMRQVYYGVTWIHGHTFLRVGIPKSLAQVWICS